MKPTGLLARLVALILLGRPLHLAGGALFYALGVAAAGYAGAPLALDAALLGLLTVMTAQLMNHYSNDYFDLDADQANPTPTRWSGGSRVLPSGQLPPQAALWAALCCGGLALVLAGFAASASPSPLASGALLLVAIVLAWVYSGPPLYLHRRGFGEPVGAFVVTGTTALSGYILQTGQLTLLSLLIILPLCLMQFTMLVAVSLPDQQGDRAVGKLTLAVLLGPERAAWCMAGTTVVAYLMLPLLWYAGLPTLVALAPLGAAPIGLWISFQTFRGIWAKPHLWDALGFWSIGQVVASAGLMLLAFLLRL
ncbi:prenyltransferase [Candidatus Viridilinea mediisalina]|uniref:Prenyltransferase n=1 Tax=Candidatus Viridilinea mediisalina TaxID=2024553 RepID=A0A2A6RL63_9CHLR|nr:prenyltransferase [Candidatus Viridilinea mediisalina]PDW03854.1 prenyltransferase [Candidatus Viridilinea mediisalina]